MNEQITMTAQVTGISDPQLRKIRDRIYSTIVLAAAKAVGHLEDPTTFPMPRSPNSLEHLLLNRLKQRPDFQHRRAAVRLKNVIHSTGRVRKRMLGELAQVDLKLDTPIAEQVETHPLSLQLTAEALESARIQGPLFISHGAVVQVEPDVAVDDHGVKRPKGEIKIRGLRKEKALDMGELMVVKKPKAPEFIKPWNTLHLRVRKTICVDETDGFLGTEAGDDEMLLGGHIIDATGDMKKVGILHLGNAFDDGEEVSYNPPLVFGSYNLKKDDAILINGKETELGWPRTYHAIVVLAEEDMGGFPGFLNDLASFVLPMIKAELTKALAGLGSILGAVGAAIGAAIGALLGELVDALFGFFVSVWEDDVFIPLTLSQTLPFPMPAWGSTTSPVVQLGWKGHGGHYRVRFDWEMVP